MRHLDLQRGRHSIELFGDVLADLATLFAKVIDAFRTDHRGASEPQGCSTSSGGFKDLIARVTLGQIGIILSSEVTRLARNCSDWYPLLDLCGYGNCLIADREGVYDPGTANGRLLLGLKGTISEVELHTIRARLTAGLLNKAARGELALILPAGLLRDRSGVVTKDPDREVEARIAFVFATFLQVRSACRVLRVLNPNFFLFISANH